MSTAPISKSTPITIGLVISMAALAFFFGQVMADVKGDTRRNTSDIAGILNQIAILNTNLTTTNGKIIELNGKLDGLTTQINRVTVVRPNPAPRITVVASRGSTQPIQPAPQQSAQPPQQNPQPGPQPDPQPAIPPGQAPLLPCGLLPILCNQGSLL
jgi:hypothetical protein